MSVLKAGATQVRDFSKYTLGDLRTATRGAWQAFAEWADAALPPRTPGIPKPEGLRFEHGYHCENTAGVYSGSDWRGPALMLVMHATSRLMIPVTLMKAETGIDFIRPEFDDLVKVAFRRLAEMDAFLRRLAEDGEAGRGVFAEVKDNSYLLNGIHDLRLARTALGGPEKLEEAFWTEMLRVLTEPLKEFESVESAIAKGEPLVDAQDALLAEYMTCGTVRTIASVNRDGAVTFENVLEPSWEVLDRYACVYAHASAILTPIAYQLSIARERSRKWPQFIVVCHNPLCQKQFYTKRVTQKVCPKSTACRNAWCAYQNQLRLMARVKGWKGNPLDHWDDKQQKTIFRNKYEPRTR